MAWPEDKAYLALVASWAAEASYLASFQATSFEVTSFKVASFEAASFEATSFEVASL